ncbi:MAG: sugar MFS transporter [Chlamydiota bacterium]
MKKQNRVIILSLMNSLFFIWGFVTVLNDILVPYFKSLFTLTYVAVMLVQFCFFAAYGLGSIPAGAIVEYLGYRKGIVLALFIATVGSFLFLPAADLPSFPLFLLAIFVVALGIVLLQVAANPYVALLGNPGDSSSRLNLAQGFNSLGTTVGPLIGSQLILSSDLEVFGINVIYGCMGLLLFLLACVILFFRFPEVKVDDYEEFQEHLARKAVSLKDTPIPATSAAHQDSIWQYPHLLYGALAIFCYVGAEVSIGSFLVNFLSSPEVLGVDDFYAGHLVSFYWGGAMLGRFAGFVLLLKYAPRKLLATCVICSSILLILGIMSSGMVAAYSVLLIGLFNSIMFPTIFTLGIRGLEGFTAKGSGILCTAITGGAIIPLIQGAFADHIGIQKAFFVPLLCYLYVLYYARIGAVARCRI